MKEDIINQTVQILLPIAITGITGIFSWIGIRIKNTFEEKVKAETKKSVVNDTVKYVEQVHYNLQGQKKLKKAISIATQVLNEKGIKASDAELYILIESSVLGMKKDLKSAVQKTELMKDELTEASVEEESYEQLKIEEEKNNQEKVYVLVESSTIGITQELTSAVQKAKVIVNKLEEPSVVTEDSDKELNTKTKNKDKK